MTLVHGSLKLEELTLPLYSFLFPLEAGLSRLFRIASALLLCCALAPRAAAQQTDVTLETSESLFSVLAGINACGYDQELATSDPLRMLVRAEVASAVQASASAATAQRQLCAFYRDHQQPDASRTYAQYISLALNLDEPPGFQLRVREADLPPDASYVLGFVPLLQRFYVDAGLHGLWLKHQAAYEAQVERLHDPVAKMLLATKSAYLRISDSSYLGRRFAVYAEPMGAPGQVNARNYGVDYFLVLSPRGDAVRIDEIRHTYLHYTLDPFAMKRQGAMKRLEPLLESVKNAPLDESFHQDIVLLVNESLIRAIEARTSGPGGKEGEADRVQRAEAAEREGYILTLYFFDALRVFEKNPVGLQDAYPDWLFNIDVGAERKHAGEITFSREAVPEALHVSRPERAGVLDLAESKLASGEVAAAQRLAQQVLDQQSDNPARALFILARAATLSRDMPGARTYFERTLEMAREPRIVAWSHIYLARIFDMQENRDAAVQHYRAALAAGDTTPDTRAAAERGLAEPYQPPSARP
ncbi:MAG TPA: tetratricopeptide repeat protein [Terriglobales bacterium]|nr:tetratricopeptide repeat protein [Terriglobales bacterium]